MPRFSREIVYWNHFQIRYFTLEEGCKNKGFVTTCHKCEYRLPPGLDNKWFSREVVYNMVAFISMFSSLLALYLSLLIWAFVICCCKANNLFLHKIVRMWPQVPEDNSASFDISLGVLGEGLFLSISCKSTFLSILILIHSLINWIMNITPDGWSMFGPSTITTIKAQS